MLYEMANDTREDGKGYDSITAYVGNLHIKPISRIWNTYRLDKDYGHVPKRSSMEDKVRKSVLKPEKKVRPFTLDSTKLSQMEYNINEPVEEKIAKHAILEALFQTQLWMEPYVKNPFIYITDHESDFEGEKGKKLQLYFKKVFYQQYNKAKAAVDKATPQEAYLERH